MTQNDFQLSQTLLEYRVCNEFAQAYRLVSYADLYILAIFTQTF